MLAEKLLQIAFPDTLDATDGDDGKPPLGVPAPYCGTRDGEHVADFFEGQVAVFAHFIGQGVYSIPASTAPTPLPVPKSVHESFRAVNMPIQLL